MQKQWLVSSSPHLRDNTSTNRIMMDVVIALAPAGIAGILLFGLRAGILMLTSVISAVLFEFIYQTIAGQKITINDGSAVVTGLLLAYNLPATAPLWIAIIGSFIAIIVVKQIFGGIGQNFMNPALTARAVLFVSWVGIMAKYPEPQLGRWLTGLDNGVDVIATATPLVTGIHSTKDLFFGVVPGVLGETSKVAILIGGIYLLIRNVIDWRIPTFFIGTVFLCYFIQVTVAEYSNVITNNIDFAAISSLSNLGAKEGLFQILSGGLMLGAFFMATDYVTAPVSNLGKIIMGIGCGLILYVIRAFAIYPEGCSFAILFMNICTPLIDRFTIPKNFGEVEYSG